MNNAVKNNAEGKILAEKLFLKAQVITPAGYHLLWLGGQAGD